ncbi:MAG: restriction endonuclease subunit S [Candidatus Delongbacteria bacterium]|nr:restriction endonuclease subunit S [Candidatus Delongbacteria bacterium]
MKDDEIPFQIPETWVRCRLGEVIDLISGQHIEEKDYNINEEGYPYLTGPSDFGKIYPTITRWTTKPKVFAIKNDVMITVKGAGVGKTNLCNLEQLVISRQLMAIRPLVISNDFIHYFLVNSFELIQSDMKGTGIPGISRENILFKTVAIPPLSEQKKIVESLDSLMKYCNDLELSIKQSKEQNEKLLQVVLKEALEVE